MLRCLLKVGDKKHVHDFILAKIYSYQFPYCTGLLIFEIDLQITILLSLFCSRLEVSQASEDNSIVRLTQ